jgi:ATP-dependent DNA helicase RecG
MVDITELIASIRAAGGDTTAVEVKSAAGGIPQSTGSTLSALANLPGGGRLILGLDEATGFTPVPLADPHALKQALGNVARSLTPPAGLTIGDAVVGSETVIVADVAECPVGQKPCYVTSTGTAYGRSFDGDFELSDLERQAFLVGRTYPRSDQDAVPGSSVADLDQALLADWIATVRERSPGGLGRFRDDAELLRRGGVTTPAGELTVAGLLALGIHPQQFFPRYVIQLVSAPAPGETIRAVGATTLDGPIPTMLAGALAWARRSFTPMIVSDDGLVRDVYEYPLDAFRELVGNALVHRDHAEWSRGSAVEVRHLHDRLVFTNPGGLFGITVDRLGTEGVTSARNGRLLSICPYVHTRDDGGRVVEALATGIPTVTASLAKVGLPPARFIDTAIRFKVILQRGPASNRKPFIRGRSALAVWEAIDGERTVDAIRVHTGLSTANVRRILRDLRANHFIVVNGGPGRPTTYRRAAE